MPVPMTETPEIEVLRSQFVAWMEGVNARFLGLTVPDCKYPSRSAAGDAWENGWDVCNRGILEMQSRKASETRRLDQVLCDRCNKPISEDDSYSRLNNRTLCMQCTNDVIFLPQ